MIFRLIVEEIYVCFDNLVWIETVVSSSKLKGYVVGDHALSAVVLCCCVDWMFVGWLGVTRSPSLSLMSSDS